jgi:hypothetical protein
MAEETTASISGIVAHCNAGIASARIIRSVKERHLIVRPTPKSPANKPLTHDTGDTRFQKSSKSLVSKNAIALTILPSFIWKYHV